ncbi:MAG TPA: hypothetical protein VD978_29160 [Azospirillum sp.]|nr:hypothetical protein [Azospirillum sp.]
MPRPVDVLPLPQEEIAAIAEHEHLTLDEAAVRGTVLMGEPHGDAAIRQMVWDNLVRARQHRDPDRIKALSDLYTRTCRRHPSPCDRRLAPTRETHPYEPPETAH